jgi:hypothetical protein
MNHHRLIVRGARMAGAVLLAAVSTIPAKAGVGPSDFDAAVSCDAFQRIGNGGWRALSPVTLHINNGVDVSFRPGDSMIPGSTVGGIAVPAILDRHCGNR